MSLSTGKIRLLRQLAELYGIQNTFYDVKGNRQTASANALRQALEAMGVSFDSLREVPSLLRKRRLYLWQRFCEPVTVAWRDNPSFLEIRLPSGQAQSGLEVFLELEEGEKKSCCYCLGDLRLIRRTELDGKTYVCKRIPLPKLPLGYHRLTIKTAGFEEKSLIICAPSQIPCKAKNLWGIFLPLYALKTKNCWGTGNYGSLKSLLCRFKASGADLVGTLPLLASFLEKPYEPSPYSPVSRLFWNEFYLNIEQIPELASSPEAVNLLQSSFFKKQLQDLRQAPLIDYKEIMKLKRMILEILAENFLQIPSKRQENFWNWVKTKPFAKDYACFRAAGEKSGKEWPNWAENQRQGFLCQGRDYDKENALYHLYVQWLAHEQLRETATEARATETGLYLDLPLGVHRSAFDTWRFQEVFALEAETGAPPDPFFQQGQNWQTPPLHPEKIREHGYDYFILSLRNHLQYASFLRLDHIMGLHHLFWVPKGMPAADGVYVRYHHEEFYAILTLEASRANAFIIGEDLGTVPAYVKKSMDRRQIHGMYILPFNFSTASENTLGAIPEKAIAALNTHDTPTFAAFWQGCGSREKEALINFLQEKGLLQQGVADSEMILQGCLAYLAGSKAHTVLVNLEDLWLETRPQNQPGTGKEKPNWVRKAQFSFEEFEKMPTLENTFRIINKLREKTKQKLQ